MIVFGDRARPRAAAVALAGGEADRLASILQPYIALAIWWRPSPIALTTLDLDDVAPLRLRLRVRDVAATVRSALADGGPRHWHDRLAADIADLSARFAAVMGTDRLEIRLERVATNACWKFHSDYVRARLITTYYGPGTQWAIQDKDGLCRVHQLATGHVGISRVANGRRKRCCCIDRRPSPIRRMCACCL